MWIFSTTKPIIVCVCVQFKSDVVGGCSSVNTSELFSLFRSSHCLFAFDLLPTIQPLYTCKSWIKFIAWIFSPFDILKLDMNFHSKRKAWSSAILNSDHSTMHWNVIKQINKWKFIGHIIWLFWSIFVGTAFYAFELYIRQSNKTSIETGFYVLFSL